MIRIYELRQKEVINTIDGTRFGFVCDMEVDEEQGRITKIIVACPGKVFGIFGREQEYQIPWQNIKRIGPDIILVEADPTLVLVNC